MEFSGFARLRVSDRMRDRSSNTKTFSGQRSSNRSDRFVRNPERKVCPPLIVSTSVSIMSIWCTRLTVLASSVTDTNQVDDEQEVLSREREVSWPRWQKGSGPVSLESHFRKKDSTKQNSLMAVRSVRVRIFGTRCRCFQSP